MQNFYQEISNSKLPQEIKEFFVNLHINSVTVSQTSKVWEIGFSCEKLPPLELIKASAKHLCNLLPEVEKCLLIPQINYQVNLADFFSENWTNLIDYFKENFPSVIGWFTNPHWEFSEDNKLKIIFGSQLAIKYLEKQKAHLFFEKFLYKVINREISVSFHYDEKFKIEVPIEENLESIFESINISEQKNTISSIKKETRCSCVIKGRIIKGNIKTIKEVIEEEPNVIVAGKPFNREIRELKTGRAILSFGLFDLTDSITCKLIGDGEEIKNIDNQIANAMYIKVKGTAQIDKFSQELVLMTNDINQEAYLERQDNAEEKRVELHLHTKMSSMDGVSSVKEIIEKAADWGHQAVAITDHGVIQAFPEAYEMGKKFNIKVIFGLEAYIFDEKILGPKGRPLTYHCIILAKNHEGLRTLYSLVTESHLKYFNRVPRIPKSLLGENRQDLIIGSACEAGELIRQYLKNKEDYDSLISVAEFYDFIEIQPTGNNEFLIRNGTLKSKEDLVELNKTLYKVGQELNKPVVATGDVHFLNPEDEVFRRILMAGKGFSDADDQAPLYFKTTEEMLEEFNYLGEEVAREVVISNPQKIANQIEKLQPIPDEFYPPQIEGAEEEIINLTMSTAHSWYGPDLPDIVEKRIKKELDSIINNGFAVLYLIAQKLVKRSNEDGYLVGSRGSVGSSFVATLTGITEVNPLVPHYRCPECFYTEFITDGSYGSGADLPDKDCPRCNKKLIKDGHDIPFEVFLGFKGDKVPDIDLNFSGEYQPRAFKFVEELFGKENVFRAGTISTIANRTAYGFVKNYMDERGNFCRLVEVERLVEGCSGVKRTTGQHPGGLMIVPKGVDIHRFTPLQKPADDLKSEIITTHFDYHSIGNSLVKLDILGHDDPTVIKMLEDLTGVDAKTIPLDDQETMKLFSSTEPLKVSAKELGSTVATYGIPEFGTKFVRQMLEDTKPKTFSELVRISGFSHGTDVWLNNAQDLIKNGVAKLSEAISTRDDIMTFLIQKGMESSKAFKIMENVRKGKGLTPEEEQLMRENNIPEWFIGSCKKIKYMFPKAHAVAYVMMAFRIAYFKRVYPLAFYASFFTVRADDFDADLVVKGEATIRNHINSIQEKGNLASAKEGKLLIILEVALEMYLRGFSFQRVNLAKSQSKKFIIEGDTIIPPFVSLQGVGTNAAENIAEERNKGAFTSIEDLRIRARLSKTVIETLREHGCLEGLAETDQLALFN